MNTISAPWIKLKERLDREDYDRINALQEQCVHKDQIVLKLELDYKLGVTSESTEKSGIHNINEFMYFDGQQIVGYIGICGFGEPGAPLEVTGMVHPEYRRQGIFTILHELVMAEWKRRNSSSMLVLCDRKSVFGQRFIEKIGAAYEHSEFELYLQQDSPEPHEQDLCGITFRKATNSDAREVARQNAIYFSDRAQNAEDALEEHDSDTALERQNVPNDGMILPEEEERRGMTIYLAEKEEEVVGKVHLQMSAAVGGIYGLGVLPEYRGKGYGRAILVRAIEKLKEANAKSIMLQVAADNAKALRLYKSCGFLETSTMDYYQLNS